MGASRARRRMERCAHVYPLWRRGHKCLIFESTLSLEASLPLAVATARTTDVASGSFLEPEAEICSMERVPDMQGELVVCIGLILHFG